jgi:asparagine N-glycosylation enzyme membrane subunit Stt3
MSRKYLLVVIWVVCSFVAAALSLEFTHATYYLGEWHPLGNDSFYHARRILDAVDSPRGFYQFDEMIHAPEGSWLTWPWAYDWLMAKFVQVWQFFDPAKDSMMIITHIAVYWIFVNAALLTMIGYVLGLPTGLIGLVLFGFALSPLTQALHGVGLIDHHYVEYTFILLTVLTGLAWLKRPEQSWRAAALGITLGIAPAFHTGLFILQLPVLFTLFVLWMQKRLPEKDSVLALAIALTLAMLAALLPSEPFQQGQFQFSVLSWFHLYIAAASTLFISSMGRFAFSPKMLGIFVIVGIALLIPIWQDTLGGAAFLSQRIAMLETISEAQSPLEMMFNKKHGFWVTLGYYSVFGLLMPLLIPVYIYRGFKVTSAAQLFFAVMVVFGMSLLLTQYRLNYFGSFAILLGWAVVLNDAFDIFRRRPKLVYSLGTVIVFLAFLPGVFHVLFSRYALSWDDMYKESLPLMEALDERCEVNPGIALVDNNFGHILRYHTACSVIANNFLMTPQHEEKIDEMWTYMSMSPEELLENKPEEMKYVFIRLAGFLQRADDGSVKLTTTEFLERHNLRLPFELNTRDDLPDRYKVIAEMPLDNVRGFTRIRVLEILPEETNGADNS